MNVATTVQARLNLKYKPVAFISENLARKFASQSRSDVVMLGEDSRYWVVCLADAEKMNRAGYEYVTY
jgi:hypothetical protein